MLGIPRRYSHFVFGLIQSGLTSLIAAGIASFPLLAVGNFFRNWLVSWLIVLEVDATARPDRRPRHKIALPRVDAR